MLRDSLPEIIMETLPGPKAQALIDRRNAATPKPIGCAYPLVMTDAQLEAGLDIFENAVKTCSAK